MPQSQTSPPRSPTQSTVIEKTSNPENSNPGLLPLQSDCANHGVTKSLKFEIIGFFPVKFNNSASEWSLKYKLR